MDYREEIIKTLMCGIDEDTLKMIYGVTRAARRDMEKRKKAGNYMQPKLSRRMKAIRLLLEVEDDAFLNEIYKVLQFHAGEGETLSHGDWCKGRIFCMLKTIDSEQDERFLNQIRTIVRLHIERKGGAA